MLNHQADRNHLQGFSISLFAITASARWNDILRRIASAFTKRYHMILGEIIRRLATIGAAVLISGKNSLPLVYSQGSGQGALFAFAGLLILSPLLWVFFTPLPHMSKSFIWIILCPFTISRSVLLRITGSAFFERCASFIFMRIFPTLILGQYLFFIRRIIFTFIFSVFSNHRYLPNKVAYSG